MAAAVPSSVPTYVDKSMRSPTSRAARPGRLLFSAVVCTMALGACSDQPVGTRTPQPVLPVGALQAFDCTVTVGEGMRCAAATPGTGQARGVLIGGQNQYVTLTSSNIQYDAGTQTYSIDVTVQNLLNEAIGTPDGVTPDPEGIRVFFFEPPKTIGAGGEVTVANADGAATFNKAAQPYFQYTEILSKDEVSASKTWQFNKPPEVNAFQIRVLISTEVQPLLVINEVLVNPGGTIADASGEWFELYNAGTLAVDLQDMVITDSAASGRRPYHLISSSVPVAPGAYVVLGNTTNTTNNGGVPVDYAYGGALFFQNSLDAVKISRVFGQDTLTIDRTQFASAAISAQNGVSRELLNPALDNSNMDGSNWADALVTAVYGPGGRGTPKAQNSTYTP
ncbi:MAG TPA: lamin tail domain-containing protein [Longimicrobium sp.]|jgi:hypothetical protein|uniref:lamin tail domain-containing protein n=1 Tax=Longimicrobium sp. TaxID=2029185 RepID=UPI002ED9D648